MYLKLGGGVNVIQGDANVYNNYDEFKFFYMSNPFSDDDIMRNLIKNIKKSILRNRRKVYIIYNNPTQERILIEQGMVIESKLPIFLNTRVVVYTFPD